MSDKSVYYEISCANHTLHAGNCDVIIVHAITKDNASSTSYRTFEVDGIEDKMRVSAQDLYLSLVVTVNNLVERKDIPENLRDTCNQIHHLLSAKKDE